MTTADRQRSLDDMTEPELSELFSRLARVVEGVLPEGVGFCLVAAQFGGPGVAQYVANVRREDAAKWMIETVQRWANKDFVPRGKDYPDEQQRTPDVG